MHTHMHIIQYKTEGDHNLYRFSDRHINNTHNTCQLFQLHVKTSLSENSNIIKANQSNLNPSSQLLITHTTEF